MKVNQEYYFNGASRDFQFKMKELIRELFSMVEKLELRKTNNVFNFKAEIKVPPLEDAYQFITPEVTKDE